MKKLIPILLSALVFCAVDAKAADASANLKAIEDLNAIATMMIAGADELAPSDQLCGLTSAESFSMSGSVRAQIDQEISKYLKARKSKRVYGVESWKTSCMSTCSCGVYASLLEAVGFEKLNLADQKIYRRVESLAREQTSKDTLACVAKTQSVCSQKAFTRLRRAASK